MAVANASTSTIPKLSPPSAGETNNFDDASSASRSSFGTMPSTSMPSSSKCIRACRRRYWSGSVPISRRRAPVRRRISGQTRSSTGSPLRASWRPTKTMRCSRCSGSAWSGMTTPFGTISKPPPSQRSADSAAMRETAMRVSRRSIRKPQTGSAARIQARSPAACHVATAGHSANASVATQIVGVNGSCRWTRSNRSVRSASRVRRIERGESTMFGNEPFAGTTTERPTGMISGGRWP